MIDWAIWAVLLIGQQAAHTAVSRARNTKGRKGLIYHTLTATFSNGVWFCSQLYIVTTLIAAKDNAIQFTSTLLFYVFFCVLGSVLMHWWMLKWEAKHHIEHG